MKYAITAASSQYGTAAIKHLLSLGVKPGGIIALVRNRSKGETYAREGIAVRELDYTGDLTAGFTGADRVLFIPAADHSGCLDMNARVVEAAEKAGVKDLIYVSFIKATAVLHNPPKS